MEMCFIEKLHRFELETCDIIFEGEHYEIKGFNRKR